MTKTKKSIKKGITVKRYHPKIVEMSQKYSKDLDEFLMRGDGRCEWVCNHGVGHTVFGYGTHGCDGCCSKLKDKKVIDMKKESLKRLANYDTPLILGTVDEDKPKELYQDRLTIVDETGRIYERHNIKILESIQDDGKTLKLFIEEKKKK